jgi:hypothetical protein
MKLAHIGLGFAVFLCLTGNLPAATPPQTGKTSAIQSTPAMPDFSITPAQAHTVGQRIWQNECAGTVAGLTSWNKSEAFPSLGIGHFIWFPHEGAAPFDESFPGLIAFFGERGVAVPRWLSSSRFCPWKTREKFLTEQDSLRMKELRQLLANTVGVQCDYIARRMARALPKMLEALPDETQRAVVKDRFISLFRTPEGLYALMDYVNFKGEGTKESERYQGQGWGMLQVLEGMNGTPRGLEAVREFSESAERALQRRVANASADRQAAEQKWLKVWERRVRGYLTP